MKRAATMFMAIALLVCMLGSIALGEESRIETVEAIRKYAGLNVEAMLVMYEVYPENFDAECAEVLYEYYCLYRTAKRLEAVEANMERRERSGAKMREALILTASYAEIDMAIRNETHRMWLAYRTGEETLDAFVTLVKIEFRTAQEGSGE